jgi:hypothetical protein
MLLSICLAPPYSNSNCFIRILLSIIHYLICLIVQSAGALALVIVDDGGCTAFDQACVPGSSLLRGEGFAAADEPAAW